MCARDKRQPHSAFTSPRSGRSSHPIRFDIVDCSTHSLLQGLVTALNGEGEYESHDLKSRLTNLMRIGRRGKWWAAEIGSYTRTDTRGRETCGKAASENYSIAVPRALFCNTACLSPSLPLSPSAFSRRFFLRLSCKRCAFRLVSPHL